MLVQLHKKLEPHRSPTRSSRDRNRAAFDQRQAGALAEVLRAKLRGEVRFRDGDRALYAADGSNYRQVPIGVVLPKEAEDVIKAVEVCRAFGAPVLGRGGGTSLAGQCCNVAVVIDMSKYMRRIIDIDPDRRLARVEPGVVLDQLRDEAEKYHLTFAPDPATHRWCTLGGMIGNNSCGVHALMGGRTSDNVHELDILTYGGLELKVGKTSEEELERIIASGGARGRIYQRLAALRDRYAAQIRARYPDIPRRVSGYNLDDLLPEKGFHVARSLVGTEGTCALWFEAKLRLIPSPPKRVLLVIGYHDVYVSGDHVPEILKCGPIGLEGVDDQLVRYMELMGMHPDDLALLPDGKGWLLVEFGADTLDEAKGRARELMSKLEREPDVVDTRLFVDKAQQMKVWEIRESGLAATAHVPTQPDAWPGWEDSAVPPDKVGPYLRELRKLLDRYHYAGSLYGHLGQGCIHTRINFDLSSRAGIEHYRAFINEAADLVLAMGGSLSGEHGDGQARAEFLPKMFGAELVEAFGEFKRIWDPESRMNPGKVVDAYRIDENLRIGTGYHPPELETHFRFAEDHGSFAKATLRCVGVGKCRRTDGGTMCPSYMVTREEEHTTRGRARLLFEMLQGEETPLGWDNEAVKESLDLCLACKGCKGECPVKVDMATYKAEFLSHYYKKHRRPMAAYSMGLVFIWARVASIAPRLVNAITHMPIVSRLFKRLGGISTRRDMPRFAPETFKHWFFARPPKNIDGPPVILWPDTFNNHFHPQVMKAAVTVLEDAGYRVVVPREALCCGRPLYDYGMLDLAKQKLVESMKTLGPLIAEGVPMVGIEPSCVAVFRDELGNMFPHDADADRLAKQTHTLGEFLVKVAKGYKPPRLSRRAIMHGHCHHKAIMGLESERKVLEQMGLDVEELDAGCCGMAGSFGYEPDKYDVSMAAGERVLLPAVREADKDTLVLADGFSCKGQIRQGTKRRALHLAEVLAMAIEQTTIAAAPTPRRRARARRAAPAAAFAAAALAASFVALRYAGQRRSRWW